MRAAAVSVCLEKSRHRFTDTDTTDMLIILLMKKWGLALDHEDAQPPVQSSNGESESLLEDILLVA